ncbi:MAG TPA: tetratricopeptide repeat protein [Accumulibacter sp.]|jgi:predicted O-linked N-acetylglucosamine transferase (SPINDLY family)|nr:tetratricopeptide repeat protein [Accumulibacter sp.]
MRNSSSDPTFDGAAIDAALVDSVHLAVAALDGAQRAEAKSLLAAVLDLRPRHPLANYHCGLMHMEDGDLESALAHLAAACDAESSNGAFWVASADCLLRMRRHDEARHLLETALAAGLDDPRAESLLQTARAALAAEPFSAPTVLDDNDRLLERLRELIRKRGRAATGRRQARPEANAPLRALADQGDWRALTAAAPPFLERHPESGKDWDLLGVAYLQLGNSEAARIVLTRAAALLPRDAAVWDHLGVAERLSGDWPTAEKAFARSLALNSGRAETWVNRGNLQCDQGQRQAALTSFQRALELDPDCAEAIGSLGKVSHELGRLDAAARYCRELVARRPDLAEGHCNLGNVQRDFGEFDDAIASYRRALTIKPALAEAHSGLGRVWVDRGRLDDALSCYEQAVTIRPDFLEAHSNLLNTMSHLGRQPPAAYLAAARRFGRQATQRARHPFTQWAPPVAGAPLRVGLVSGDLRQHPVGYFLENVLAHLDKDQIELHAYATHDEQDALSARLRPHLASWTALTAMSDQAAASRIHADRMQVLLDLSGHTAHNRLPVFAWRPAPVQASWLGYFATTGLTEMDYLLADPQVVPAGEEADFSETVWRLPETYLCFTPPAVGLDLDVRPLPARDGRAITFGCFNNLAKLNDAVLDVWARVLLAVPGSRLLLKTALLDEENARRTTLGRFAQRGIAAERVLCEGRSPRAELLAAYHRVDIALDPFPYPGGTTSVEALWMGVPVLTRRGDRFLSRVGETIARNAGLADWIARDDDGYVALAAAHSHDLAALAGLRAALRERLPRSPLFDAPRFARHLAAALQGMWQAKAHREHPVTGRDA